MKPVDIFNDIQIYMGKGTGLLELNSNTCNEIRENIKLEIEQGTMTNPERGYREAQRAEAARAKRLYR